jgi:hypothetical protein
LPDKNQPTISGITAGPQHSRDELGGIQCGNVACFLFDASGRMSLNEIRGNRLFMVYVRVWVLAATAVK